MDKMTHVDSMMVIGTRLPVKENQYMHFEWGDYDNITGQYSDGYLYEWYHTLNELEDLGLYCEYITTPISTEDLLEENDNKNLLSEAEFNARKEVIKDHLNKQKQQLAKYEQSEIGKFLIDPEKYPFEQECIISGRLITKTYKTTQDRDKLLAGYNENKYEEIMSDIHKLQDEGGDENSFDISARQNLYVAKYLHSKLINGIKVNTENLNKLEVAQSSLFAIPAPSVPALAPNNGLNIGINQNSDHHIASGIEKTLGNIRDGLAETFDCSFGMSCSNDLDKAAKNPNVGKELTAEEKEALGISSGGSATGTPNGFEPDDEEHKYNQQQQQNESKFKNFSEEDLISSANKPINKQGLSTAARAWDKHAARPDEVFEPLKGNPAQKNAAAENFIREILKDPKVVRKDLSGGAFEYRLPSGKGIRYNADGSFNTVLDPTKVKK